MEDDAAMRDVQRAVRRLVQSVPESDDGTWLLTHLGGMGLLDLVDRGPDGGDITGNYRLIATIGAELLAAPGGAAFWLSGVVAPLLLASIGATFAKTSITKQLATSSTRVTPAIDLDRGSLCRTTARPLASGGEETEVGRWALSGSLKSVFALSSSDWLLVQATLPEGCAHDTGLFATETCQRGVLATTRPSWSGESVSSVELAEASSVLLALGCSSDISHLCETALLRAAALQSSQLVELARKAFELTVEYVKEHRQFDRALSSLQVVRHHLADSVIDINVAEAMSGAAVLAAGEEPSDLLTAAIGRLSVYRRTEAVVLRAHRLHGGIGYYQGYPLEQITRSFVVTSRAFGSFDMVSQLAAELSEQEPFMGTVSRIRNPRHRVRVGRQGSE